MKVNFQNQNFENIKIQNTVLVRANFVRCNFKGSSFENIDISGINLNGALPFNCKQKKAQIEEMTKLEGHKQAVQSVCFSQDGTTLASGSRNQSIRFWDCMMGQQKPNQMVIVILSTQSVSLLMEIHQLLVVMITLSVYGISKQVLFRLQIQRNLGYKYKISFFQHPFAIFSFQENYWSKNKKNQ
ncbi:unnamed protein product [Paramecium primaurelia]|uniref:Uncharacterized protein n=1 Tax=Paramecium primaurelia TaxID=5886 RepID=A0A8S1KR33_PARPR|nr:unnamed protein product [Paramecium primaurelia]